MSLKDKLHLKDFCSEISFTDTKKTRKGIIYHKNELLFHESSDCIGSFPVKTGDLILIYTQDYLLNPEILPRFYSEADGPDYTARKEFLNK